MSPDVTLAAGIVAAALLLIGVPLLIGRVIAGPRIDPADVPYALDVETAIVQAVAVGNDDPDPEFLARTRALVVDELAQRRGATS